MFPIINPFEAAAQWNASASQIYKAAATAQLGIGMMMLETMHNVMQGPPPKYAVAGKVVFTEVLTPNRYAEATAEL